MNYYIMYIILLTFIAKVDGDVLFEIKPIYNGSQEVSDHTGTLDFDV